jgi:hypothetical protein
MSLAVRLVSLILPSILFLVSPAWADDLEIDDGELQIGTGLVCYTQEQVKRFVSVYDGDVETAVNAVNAEEHGPNACVIVTMVYVPGDPIATAIRKDKTFQIVPVLVIGIVTSEGVQAVEPIQFFSAVEVEGQEI